MLKIPRLLRFLTVFIICMTLLLALFRVSFYFYFVDPLSHLSNYDFWMALWLGSRFDLRMIVIMVAPLFFLGWIPFLSPFKNKIAKKFWLGYLGAMFATFLLFYAVDAGYYAYLGTRLDFTSTRLLVDFKTSMEMVWESYPVIWIFLGYFSLIGIFIFFINKLFTKLQNCVIPESGWGLKFFIGFASFFIMFALGWGKLDQYPLRWSDASFSKHPFASQLTYNPIHYFFDTWKNGREAYDIKKVKEHYDVMADYLGIVHKDKANLNFKREAKPILSVGTKPNVVIVIMESFASYKSSVSGNPIDPSPNLKEYADKGWYFKNFYTPTVGTARSIYATLTSLPDVELHGTSSRNPLIVNQHSIFEDFKDYKKLYFIGGSASWGNIRGMLNESMDNLDLYEEERYSAPRTDVWGISDADLALESSKVLAQEKEPFVAIIQTSGNHRPYTIPANDHGFKIRTDVSLAEVKKYGFASLEEYNSFRFLDYSVGLFMSEAKKSAYYKNTIFVFWGDHGIDGYSQHVPPAESTSNLALGSYRVPFVIYSPMIRDPKVVDTVMSELDAVPSIASLAGISYTATTLGRNIFNPKFKDSHYAYIMMNRADPTLGVVGEKYCYKTTGKYEGLYEIASKDPMVDHRAEHPELFAKMKELTQSIYETAKYIPYFNKRKDAHE